MDEINPTKLYSIRGAILEFCMRKKTVIIHTDWSKLKTGFAKNKRAILRYLFNTGKYNLVESCNGFPYQAKELESMPWKTFGALASPEKHQEISNHPDPAQRENNGRLNNYGAFGIEKIIKENKADVLVVQQDSWGLDFFPDLSCVRKMTLVPHCTIDSKNLLPSQIDLAAKVDKLYLWASFGVEMYKELGYQNVEHLYGCVETDKFSTISEDERNALRAKFNLQNSVVGVNCFRNQTRKSIPNILDGFKLFKERNPSTDLRLIFVTSLQEGWDIPRLLVERGLSLQDVYFAYYCRQCKNWEIRPFSGHDQDCPICGSKGTFNTVNITHGISDEDLNLIYNIADFGLGVFNSGGLEIPPAIEMKLAKLPVLCTSYSCGEDIVKKGALALDWAPTYEFGSAFLKASTLPTSICERFEQVSKMTREERLGLGGEGREYVLENMSPEVIGAKLEKIIDDAPFVDWKDEDFLPVPKNPAHVPPNNLSPEDFAINLLTEMMNEKVDKNTSHVKNWAAHLKKSGDYQGVYKHFVNLAHQFNANLNNKPVDLADLLDKDDESRRCAIVLAESAGDLIIVNSLLAQFKALYPEYNLYFFTKPEFFDLVEGNPAVHRVLPWFPAAENIFFMIGNSDHRGYFRLVKYLGAQTQKFLAYQNDRVEYKTEWLN